MRTKRYRAAGGVVLDGRGRVLLIERDVVRSGRKVHEVRLPKGHVEEGETDEQAAVREVGEETGYWGVSIVADLGENHVEFEDRDKFVIRDERYFLMRLTQDKARPRELDPAKEESLFEVRWVGSLGQAEGELTFEGERLFVRKAAKWLAARGAEG
ncbi:MAG: NUDIX domain-containing protein [Phycisphaeraceae bacterium]|nr:NUDIX domain-containing protein [Phycisphaeraceae bacterium]